MSGSVTSTPSSLRTHFVRPWKTWWATCRPEASWALSGSMETGSPGSGNVSVPPGLGVPSSSLTGAPSPESPEQAAREAAATRNSAAASNTAISLWRARVHQRDERGHTSARPAGVTRPVASRAASRRPAERSRTRRAAEARRQPSLQMRTNVFRKNSTPTMIV